MTKGGNGVAPFGHVTQALAFRKAPTLAWEGAKGKCFDARFLIGWEENLSFALKSKPFITLMYFFCFFSCELGRGEEQPAGV